MSETVKETPAGKKLPAKPRRPRRPDANPGGRPEWEPARLMKKRPGGVRIEETAEEAWDRARNWVRHCMSIGIAVEAIGNTLEPTCSPPTLRKHFAHELDYGKEHQTALIAGALTRNAMAGDTNAAKFWLERQAGWTNKLEASVNVMHIRSVPGDEEE